MKVLDKCFYSRYGIKENRKQDFITPRKDLIDKFTLPENVNLHIIPYDHENVMDDTLIRHVNKSKLNIISILEFNKVLGGSVLSNVSKKAFTKIDRDKKHYNYYTFTDYEKGRVRITNTDPNIFVYNLLEDSVRYSDKKSEEYFHWLNLSTTLFNNIVEVSKKDSKHNYINIKIPGPIPNLSKLDKLINKKPKDTFNEIKHLDMFMFIDILKWLTPNKRKTSTLSILENTDINKITFVLLSNSNYTLLNMGVLSRFIKGYSEEGKMTSKEIKKYFIVLCSNLQSDEDIVINESVDDKQINKIINTKVKEIEVRETIKESVIKRTINDDPDIEETLTEELTILYKNKLVNANKYKTLTKTIKEQGKKKSPYNNKLTLEQDRLISEEDLSITKKDISLPDIDTVPDKRLLRDTINNFDKKYLKNIYHKDMLNMIYGIQGSGVVIDGHDITTEESILGTKEIHSIKLKPLVGNPSTIKVMLPKIEDDGSFVMKGVKYMLKKQRADYPIRKIDSVKVALSSYYGKLFITRSLLNSNDMGVWFKNNLSKLAIEDKPIISLLLLADSYKRVKTPRLYASISKHVKSFRLRGVKFGFDYNNRTEFIGKLKIEDVEDSKTIVVSNKDNKPVLMDTNGILYLYNNKKRERYSSIWEEIGIRYKDAPIERSSIKILGNIVPLGMVLIYYVGLSSLLKTLNVKYDIIGKRERIAEDKWGVTFNDSKIVFDINDYKNNLILGALEEYKLELKKIDRIEMDDKEVITSIFMSKKSRKMLTTRFINELNLLEAMYIDPITKGILKDINEPDLFKPLLLRASELLVDEYYPDPQDSDYMLTKGHERITGMVYKELVGSIRTFKQTNMYSSSKVEMSPFKVWNTLNSDETVILVDNINPIGNLKQKEEITYLGAGGRSKETMALRTRVYHKNDVGTIAISNKDSQDVGITMNMTANPKMKNLRGVKDNFSFKEDGSSSFMDTTFLLSAAAEHED